MKTKFIFLIVTFLIDSYLCLGQKQDYIWIFGDSCGINFANLSNPTAFITNELHTYENYNSISDKNGNLLFYVNGSPTDSYGNLNMCNTIYNSQFQLMDNGDSIKSDYSETQGSLIIPYPNNNNKYYLFQIQETLSDSFTFQGYSLYYSIIDLSLNGGLGKVISKNILLQQDSMEEKLTAVKHGNGIDWWVITHLSNSDKFNIYYISSNGISPPLRQSIGSFIPGYPGSSAYCENAGQMKVSEQGDKLVYLNLARDLYLFDFNRCTGTLSNSLNLHPELAGSCGGYYGCSFSQSGKRLYVTTVGKNMYSDIDTLFQYDLTANSIIDSKIQIWIDTNSSNTYREIGQHQLGPDGKIYISNCYSGIPTYHYSLYNSNLSVINYPDSLGLSCNFTPYSFNLAGGHCSYGLPNLPNYNLGRWIDSPCDTLSSIVDFNSTNLIISIYPNPAKDNITIIIGNNEEETYNFELFDIVGNKVFSKQFTTSENSANISLNSISKGIYVCRILDSKNIKLYNGKLVIIK